MPWSPFLLTGPQLSHVNPSKQRTIIAGFLGFGRIAQATLHRMVAFGVTDVIFATSSSNSSNSSAADYSHLLKQWGPQLQSVRKVPVAEVAQNSDVVFVLTPGGPKTHHLVDEAFLRKMKPDAILVNASRGTVVDSDALAKALREKWIWGAGLDVVQGEPRVGLDHPLVKEPR
jgi:glyoxylate/hydroxypyruvate reductase